MADELTRTELRRISEEFKSERDAAKRDAMRAFDERNNALAQVTDYRDRALRAEKLILDWKRTVDEGVADGAALEAIYYAAQRITAADAHESAEAPTHARPAGCGQNDALDAKRYRWLRDSTNCSASVEICEDDDNEVWYSHDGASLDAAIDHALQDSDHER